MYHYSLLCFFITSIFSQTVCSQSLSQKIDALIEQELPHAMIGIFVKDAQTGRVIYSKNASTLLSPASCTKLFTAAAALYELKPDYRFSTTLSQQEKNYYLTFNGSPSFTSDNLSELLLHLKKNNVTAINGSIIIDASRFKSPNYAGGVSYDDLGWYYSAPDSAVIMNENAVPYDFISSKKLGMPVKIKPKNEEKSITIINQVITVNKEQAKNHCNLNIEMEKNNTLYLFGCFVQNKEAKTMKLAIPNPTLLVKQTIKEILNKNNIIFKGTIITGKTPAEARPIATLQSHSLVQLVTHMLQESDNLYANSLTKELAYTLTKEGTYKQGVFAIKSILSQNTHLDMKQLDLSDGMGTRYNLITPEQIVVLLTDLYNNKNLRTILLTALPQAGVSGTLKDRMKKTNLEKIVFAKTGTMHDISSLSGYLIHPNADPLIFSIIINGINTPINKAKSLEEQILMLIDEENSSMMVGTQPGESEHSFA